MPTVPFFRAFAQSSSVIHCHGAFQLPRFSYGNFNYVAEVVQPSSTFGKGGNCKLSETPTIRRLILFTANLSLGTNS